jgi:Ca2+-binding EF-hand superfamily protein
MRGCLRRHRWAWFLEIDHDRSGVIEFSELCSLGKALGLEWSKRRLRKAYEEMCQSTPFGNREGVTFEDFAAWWARYEVMRRRDVGRVIKELFQNADVDGSGILDKEEFSGLLQRANAEKSIRRHAIQLPKRFLTPGTNAGGGSPRGSFTGGGSFRGRAAEGGKELAYATASNEVVEEADFELEGAWEEIRKIPLDAEGKVLGVNFAGFETWWKLKTGMIDPDIPGASWKQAACSCVLARHLCRLLSQSYLLFCFGHGSASGVHGVADRGQGKGRESVVSGARKQSNRGWYSQNAKSQVAEVEYPEGEAVGAGADEEQLG